MSKKLEGNGRRSVKMLLTDHTAKYEQRDLTKRSGKPNADELLWIRDTILLPHLMTMLQRAHDEVKRSEMTLHQVMAQFLRVVMDHVTLDMFNLRRQLRQHNIKLLTEETQDDIFYHKYVCRGYEDRFGMTREVMRGEIGNHLKRFVNQVLRPPTK
ncbi:hypothetical protein [Cohnella phaseoli]|nr:hypothetical protein [Cohnella phaseoli]